MPATAAGGNPGQTRETQGPPWGAPLGGDNRHRAPGPPTPAPGPSPRIHEWVSAAPPHGRWALICKVHHSMVDGVSGSDIFRLILDPTPEPA